MDRQQRKKFSALTMLDRDSFLSVVRDAPLVSIDLLLVGADRRILVGQRINEPARHCWFVPGGRIHKDETLAQAFERISKAELGLTLRRDQAQFIAPFEHFYHSNFAAAPGIRTHYIVLAHRIELGQHTLHLPADQHSGYRWVDRDELASAEDIHPYSRAYAQHL